MQYRLTHITDYHYSQPVALLPHIVRLRPRCDGHYLIQSSQMTIDPQPAGQSNWVDIEGNAVSKIWFNDQKLSQLRIEVKSEVTALNSNPFNFLLDPNAVQLPIHYSGAIAPHLQPYLQGQYTQALDPTAVELAQDIYHQVNRQVVSFLTTLNQRIHNECDYTVRETGEPFPAGITWRQRCGSCRDYAVLFVEACRAVGLAARFVSGYQEPDPDVEVLDLHAWAEVYLPSAGWRGFDPTNNVAVSERHIPVAAAAHPRYAAPISGSLHPGSQAQSQMKTHIQIEPL